MKESVVELIARFAVAAFGAAAIPLFTFQHLPDYFERGGVWPQIFQGVMIFIVWPSWWFLSYREIKKTYNEIGKD